MVDFVRCPAGKEVVRSVLVVPVEVEGQFSSHVTVAQWDDDSARALMLERADASFDHSNAAVLADSAKPRLDASALAPCLEALAPELATLIGDDVLGRATSSSNGPVEKPLDFGGGWTLEENRETDHGS